jgi:hypothetical protein
MCCLIAWLLNLAPVLAALLQAIPKGSGVDYAVVHDALSCDDCLNSDRKHEQKWVVDYETHLVAKQNHGAALMCLADANGMELVTFDDFAYAMVKANDLHEGRDDAGSNVAHVVADHIMSQVRRIAQHTFLSGALTNGLQLNVQLTALAIFQYDRPLSNIKEIQPIISISLSAIALGIKLYQAVRMLWATLLWLPKVEALESRADHRNASRNELPSSRLREGMKYIFTGVVICTLLVLYAVAKLVALLKCPYSLWNVTGCYIPAGLSDGSRTAQ